ncbi:Ferredoxin-type protein [uncultured Desulfobacterium sp.]|uniref:Ferredoxin-type protein n=1 Tax=uncultured Desulfobacterium sp. TaxID=201089 RepID=A0A445MTX2_9BACT|nr:Ferredoxin-type protein [uncultured Desulfobacterium sp.]
MRHGPAKKIRAAVCICFIAAISISFLDIKGSVPSSFINSAVFFQFIPSLIKFINTYSGAFIGFIIVLILLLIFGRVYCSFLCPLGGFFDIIIFVRRKIRKVKFRYTKAHNFLRYSVLLITVIALVTTGMTLITILDPFSNFGRIITCLARPVFISLNNLTATTLEHFDIYSVAPFTYKPIQISILLYTAIFFAVATVLSLIRGRLYCNTICPVGSLFGLVSYLSAFKFRVDKELCTGCGLCEKVCKSNCIDSVNNSIDFSRCVCCFNCYDSCPAGAILYSHSAIDRNRTISAGRGKEGRRAFLAMILLLAIRPVRNALAQNRIVVYKMNLIPVRKNVAVTPPGSKGIARFRGSCTACYLCVSVCPGQVIQPSLLESGAILLPVMDNRKGFCNYECKKCSEICPSGAILPISLEEKKLTQIGIAKFIKDNCVVVTQKTECCACSEHCPTKAVHEVIENNLRLPQVNEEICVGCGACEHVCPALPHKAIYVEGNYLHKTAKPPVEEKLKPVEPEKGFPF